MKTDRIFVLLLVVMLPMSGCFDDAVGDAEGTDDANAGTTVINNYYNNTTQSNAQQLTYFSSGGTYSLYWDDNGVSSNDASACKDWGPMYDQDTGDYLGEGCRETGYRDAPEQWNVSECTDLGGDAAWPDNAEQNPDYYYKQAPTCSAIEVKTINTSAGEALLLYQVSGVSMTTTCNGVTTGQSTTAYLYGVEYLIATGSALDCTHVLTYTMSYGNYDSERIWSFVYAIQDVTVV